MYERTTYSSPLGTLTLMSHQDHLIGLWMEGQTYVDLSSRKEIKDQTSKVLDQAKDWLDRYFHKEQPSIAALPLEPIGTEFQTEVWNILCEIPYGELATYGDIAKQLAQRLGKPHMSAQAIGGAVGHNPISIIIPCHRVVGASGSLTGYAGGIDRKIALLEHEGVDLSHLYVPKKTTTR